MVKAYQFAVEGTGAEDQSFTTSGTFTCEFHFAFDLAMRETFNQLTSGRAVYGKPGVGCSGPYDIHKIIIEQVKQ